MLNTQDVVEWFSRSPQGQQLVADREAEHYSTREQLAEQLETIRAERLAAAKAEGKVIAKAEAELKAKQDAAAAAFARLRQLQTDRSSAEFRFDSAVQKLECELRETSDPAIDAFIDEMNAEGIELCKSHSILSETQAKTDNRGNTKVVTVSSNLESVKRRLAAIGVARQAAERLRYSASRDITGELQSLRDGLPAIRLEPTGA